MKIFALICFALIITFGIINSLNKPKELTISLPEEIRQATSQDTLICIKRNDTLFIEFNNKY
jgi:hypothetical protein